MRLAVFSTVLLSSALGAQLNWTQLTPATMPPKRSDHVLAADRVSIWMFGGRPQPGAFVTDETYRYLGNSWIKLSPKTKPAGRWHTRMVWDLARARLVLFGGRAPSGYFNDTWEYVGNNWVKVTTATAPSLRWRHTMVYDERNKRTVLFGGTNGSVGSNETWTYDSTGWKKLSPKTSPPGRFNHVMTYDSRRGVCVVFGGQSGTTRYKDTWEFDGNDWKMMTPKVSPPATWATFATYDAYRDRSVMFSGLAPGYVNTTWEYNGATWEQRKTAKAPTVRSGAPLAYLAAQRKVFTFGGFHPTPKQIREFWSLGTDKLAGFATSGTACKGSAGVPAMSSTTQPWLGGAVTIEVSNAPQTAAIAFLGFSNKNFGPIPLPFKLDGLGGTGCFLYTSLDLGVGAPVVKNVAKASFPFPLIPSLAGVKVYHQFLMIDAKANKLGMIFSELGTSTLGLR